MSLVIRDMETGSKKEFPAWSREAVETVLGGKLDTMQKLMIKMRYTTNASNEVYAVFPNLVVQGGDYRCISCPRISCYGFSPAEEGILHAFRSMVIKSFAENKGETPADISGRQSTRMEGEPGVYRFCLKQKWYRIIGSDGTSREVEHKDLGSVLAPGTHISMEIHLSHMRTYMNPQEKECILLQPIVRKITIH